MIYIYIYIYVYIYTHTRIITLRNEHRYYASVFYLRPCPSPWPQIYIHTHIITLRNEHNYYASVFVSTSLPIALATKGTKAMPMGILIGASACTQDRQHMYVFMYLCVCVCTYNCTALHMCTICTIFIHVYMHSLVYTRIHIHTHSLSLIRKKIKCDGYFMHRHSLQRHSCTDTHSQTSMHRHSCTHSFKDTHTQTLSPDTHAKETLIHTH
jgi:hypothetical protein